MRTGSPQFPARSDHLVVELTDRPGLTISNLYRPHSPGALERMAAQAAPVSVRFAMVYGAGAPMPKRPSESLRVAT